MPLTRKPIPCEHLTGVSFGDNIPQDCNIGNDLVRFGGNLSTHTLYYLFQYKAIPMNVSGAYTTTCATQAPLISGRRGDPGPPLPKKGDWSQN